MDNKIHSLLINFIYSRKQAYYWKLERTALFALLYSCYYSYCKNSSIEINLPNILQTWGEVIFASFLLPLLFGTRRFSKKLSRDSPGIQSRKWKVTIQWKAKSVNDMRHSQRCCLPASNRKLFWEALAPAAYGWQWAFSLHHSPTSALKNRNLIRVLLSVMRKKKGRIN